MKLELSTWLEVEAYLERSRGIVIPVGSTEQHGPIGLIGTDALCAQSVAHEMAQSADILIAPRICYTPAPFNLAFPGTMSISEHTFEQAVRELIEGVQSQGFRHIYFLNGHGANLAPLKRISEDLNPQGGCHIRVRSW